jgi:peptide subunit release factor RF-3
MKDYTVEKLRNVCLLSHGGAGKTTLAEAMLFNTGVLDRFGKVNDGNTTTDYDRRKSRGRSRSTPLLHLVNGRMLKSMLLTLPATSTL